MLRFVGEVTRDVSNLKKEVSFLKDKLELRDQVDDDNNNPTDDTFTSPQKSSVNEQNLSKEQSDECIKDKV